MTAHELSASLKNTARQKLNRKYGNAIVIVILYLLIQILGLELITFPVAMMSALFSVVTGSVEIGVGYYILIFLLQTVFSVFVNIMNTGLALFFLNIACGRTALVSNLLYGFQYLFKKSLAISAILVAIDTVIMLPYNICYFMYTSNTPDSTKWSFYMVITMLVGSILALIVSLVFSQVYYLLLDFPRYSVKQLFSLSVRLMKKRKLKYLYLDLSFLPLELLGILSFGIGFLWIIPYRMQAMALFFLDAMKSADKSES